MYIPVSYWQTQGGGTFLTGSILTAWQTAGNYYNTASTTVWPDASTNNNNAEFRIGDTSNVTTMSVSGSSIVFNNNKMVYQTYPMNATPSSSFSLNVYGEFNSGSLGYPLFANATIGSLLGWDTILYRPGTDIYSLTASFFSYNTNPGGLPFRTDIILSGTTLFTGTNLLTVNVSTNPTTLTGSIEVYVNGILNASQSNAINIRPFDVGPGNIQFGAGFAGISGISTLNNAKIKDVFIYNRQLTQAEILSNYNALIADSYPFRPLYTTTYYNTAENSCIGWNTGDRGNFYYINQSDALTTGTTIYVLPYSGSPLTPGLNTGGISDGTNYYTLNTSGSITAINSC